MFALIFLGLIAIAFLVFATIEAFKHEYGSALAAVIFGGVFAFITLTLTDAYVADRPGKCEQAGGVMIYGGECINKNAVIDLNATRL